MKINQAINNAATDAITIVSDLSATALEATNVCTSPPICVTKAIAKVQVAAFIAGRSPTPRQEKFKEKLIPIFFHDKNKIRDWAATPRVAEPPSRAI
jgi:hypothetical protein